MPKIKVAMIAPPWLSIPPKGYGGIEEVLAGLVPALAKLDVKVELFSIAPSKIKGVPLHSFYDKEQYRYIHLPLYEAGPTPIAQEIFALNYILKKGDFDIIHDHNGFIGPLALSYFTQIPGTPPALHTLHGPPFDPKTMPDAATPDSRPMWQLLGQARRLYYVGISKALMRDAPPGLRRQVLPVVYNAVRLDRFPFQPKKQNHFVTLARFSPEKGQHLAVKICDELGLSLKMAGTVAGIGNPKQLLLELAHPLSSYRSFKDFKYYSDKVWPLTVKSRQITYVGNLGGSTKLRFLANAKALLAPIEWEEPFGMYIIEALACGTPVVTMDRGAMPEIIKHGVNGFLAKNAAEFRKYMLMVGQIDPAACRRSVQERFSTEIMARTYLDRYLDVINRDNR